MSCRTGVAGGKGRGQDAEATEVGAASRVCDAAQLRAMADRRADTALPFLDAGHAVHVDAREKFAAACRRFPQEA